MGLLTGTRAATRSTSTMATAALLHSGAHSVVSAEGGVGDQRSGWNGRSYIIIIKAQQGPEMTDAYELGADGKQLVEKLHISSYELPAVDLKRVYDLTSDATPHQLPTGD